MKDNLEDLIRRGYFTQYKAKTNEEDVVKAPDQNIQSQMEEIHLISGKLIHGGSVNRSKASLKEFRHQVNYNESMEWRILPIMPTLSFTIEDAKHVIYPHDDPLSTCLINRILVDGGSSANTLFLLTFDKLMIGRQHLKPVRYPVIGFT